METKQLAQDKQVILSLVNYDKLFYNDPDAKVLNSDTIVTSTNQLSEIISTIFLDGNKDLNFVSSCDCGKLSGLYFEGMTCPYCKTKCSTNFAETLKFRAWLELPDFIPPCIHPVVYNVLNKKLGTKKGIKVLQSLLDPNTELPIEMRNDPKVGKGFWWFYNNFDNIINYLINDCPLYRSAADRKKLQGLKEFIRVNRDKVFVRHIPILNQVLHMITRTGTMQHIDECVKFILNANIELTTLLYVLNHGTYNRTKFLDQRMWAFQDSIQSYTKFITDKKLIGKIGFIRKLTLGSRLHCSFRGVITPICGKHRIDEIHLPWCIGVREYKLELINVLINRYKYTLEDAIEKVAYATNNWDKDIADIFKILISEVQQETVHVWGIDYPVPGLPVTFGRNPSLRFGAVMLLFVTKIKDDIADCTISLSDLIRSAPNFDFDGDAMSGNSIKELDSLEHGFMNIHPVNLLLGGDKPGITSDVELTKSAILAINCFLNYTQLKECEK